MKKFSILFNFIFLVCLGTISGQIVTNLNITPINLKVEDQLILSFNLSAGDNSTKDITIELIIWTKSDDKAQLKRVENNKQLAVRDNGPGDLDPASNQIKMNLYKIPAQKPPLKYTAIVTTKTYSKSVSRNLLLSVNSADIVKKSNNFAWEGFQKYPSLFNMLLLSLRSDQKLDTRIGLNKLYRYDVVANKLEKLKEFNSDYISTTKSSPNNLTIAMIVTTDKVDSLLLYYPNQDSLVYLKSGNTLETPFWLNNDTIVYIDNHRLKLVSTHGVTTQTTIDTSYIDRIISCFLDTNGNHNVIYRANDPHVPGHFELYLFQFDHQLNKLNDGLLPNNPNVYFVESISRYNGDIVSCEEIANGKEKNRRSIFLYKSDQNGKKVTQELTKDNNNYCDPRWSTDGKYITITSDK